ncbi:MAG: hypothetical protein IIC39_05280 [Candidatus Marinimicrobia bacterium]|nr:hypothetical protein [Candidatus Neomarinimicrobiota bacterium]MCH8303963.1 hypothetical protein [Candidatus Neomarinimicrobiota bacterium]
MKIFVENLTHSVANNDLIKLFELWGEVESLTIKNDNISGQPGGFVEAPNRLEALDMIQNVDGIVLFGKALKLSVVREEDDRRNIDERRSSEERRNNEDRRIASDRRVKSVSYAYNERFNSERRVELGRRLIITRRLSSDRRAISERRV